MIVFLNSCEAGLSFWDYIKDVSALLLSAITAIVSICAIIQTGKQIKLSNKQKLFDKRVDAYWTVVDIINLHKDLLFCNEGYCKPDSINDKNSNFSKNTQNALGYSKLFLPNDSTKNILQNIKKCNDIYETIVKIQFLFNIKGLSEVIDYAKSVLHIVFKLIWISIPEDDENVKFTAKLIASRIEFKKEVGFHDLFKDVNKKYQTVINNKTIVKMKKQINL